MAKNGYLVSTTMGNTFLESGDFVWVRVNPHSGPPKYLEKYVGDLNPGEMVVYSKPYTRTTLADVEPFLPKSPRYAFARDILHEQNGEGRYVPKLRTLLIRGMAKNGVVSKNNLEEKILFEANADFSKTEYDVMNGVVSNAVTIDGKPQMSYSGIHGWLNGEVLAPRNWNLFAPLSVNINPLFNAFKEFDEDPKGMYFNYRLYVTIRQGVMRFLNQAKGFGGEEGWNEADSKISLSPEFAIVFHHFLKDMNIDYAAARVTGIKKLEGRVTIDGLKRENELIDQGVVKSNKLQLPRKNYAEIFDDQTVLESYLHAAIEDFDCWPMNLGNSLFYPNSYQRGLLAGFIIPHILKLFDEDLDIYNAYAQSLFEEVNRFVSEVKDVKPYINKISTSISNGDFDAFLNLSRGTALKLIESDFRTSRALPKKIQDYVVSVKRLFRSKKVYLKRNVGQPTLVGFSEDLKVLKDGQRFASERYGLEFDLMANHQGVTPISGTFVITDIANMSRTNSPRKVLDIIAIENPSRISLLVKKFNNHPLRNPINFILTRNRALNILKEYGLEQIVDLRKQDFYWEDFSEESSLSS